MDEEKAKEMNNGVKESKLNNFEKVLKDKVENEKRTAPKTIYGLGEVKDKEILEKNIVLDNDLKVVNDLIRKHGIVQVNRYSKHKRKKLNAQERFLNVLDMLYEKAIKTSDVKAAVEYLNRTAGSVAQTFDLNENKKKLIMMGNMQTPGQAKKDEYMKTIAKVPPIAKDKKEEDEEV